MRALVFGLLAGIGLALAACTPPPATPTAIPPTATTRPTPIPTPTRPPTPTLSPFQLTAQAQYTQQLATQGAARDTACRYVADIYRKHGQVFDPTKDPQLIIAEVRVMEGLSDTNARLSYGGSILDNNNNAQIQRCVGR